MSTSWFSRQLKRATKKQHLSSALPRLEVLEDRLVLATRVWDGNALSNNWSNRFNWAGDVAPVSGDDLVFPAGAFNDSKVADNNLGNNFFVRSITFLGHGFTVKGNSIALGAGGIKYINGSSSGSNTIQNDIQLTNPTTIQVHDNDAATVSLELILSGKISGGSNQPLTKIGNERLTLKGNNSYTGSTNILGGSIEATHENALGTTFSGTFIGINGNLSVVNDNLLGRMDFSENLTVESSLSEQGGLYVTGKVDLHSNILLNTGIIDFEGDCTFDGLWTHSSSIGISVEGKLEFLTPLVLNMPSNYSFSIEGLIGVNGQEVIFRSPISGTGSVGISAVVRFTGDISNTYSGSTFVSDNADLILDKSSGARAIPHDLIIGSGATVTLKRNNQLNPSAEVRNFGKLLLDGNQQTVSSLSPGGSIDTRGAILNGSLTVLGDINGFGGNFNGNMTVLGDINGFGGNIDGNLTVHGDIDGFGGYMYGNLILGSGTHILNINNNGIGLEETIRIYSDITGTHDNTALILSGGGEIQIEGQVNLSANTTVDRATLIVNGRFTNSTIIVNSNGFLTGKGSIGGLEVNAGGIVSPGRSTKPAILRVNGDVNFKPGSTLRVSLNGPIAGIGFDQIKVDGPGNSGPGSGIVQFNGVILDAFVGLGNAIGDTFKIIENDDSDQTTGQTFATLTQTSVPQGGVLTAPTGENFIVNYFGSFGNNDVILTRTTAGALFPNRSVTPQVVAGGVVTLTGIVSDPDRKDTFILHINWGDGSPVETKVYGPSFNGKQVFIRHRYMTSQVDPYVIQLNWHDQRGAGNSGTLTTLVTASTRAAKATDAIFASLLNLKEKKSLNVLVN